MRKLYPVCFLSFADERGLALPRWNTIRLGGTWGKRLAKGNRVLLAHKHQIVGSAHVIETHVGRVHEMLALHGHSNHIELAMAAEDPAGYDPRLAHERRFASMQRNYGPHKAHDNVLISVIYLRRR
jgi:hypothetical protein